MPKSASFIIDARGKQATAGELVDSGRRLWFNPKFAPALIDRRGGSLRWYTRHTGAVACSPTYDVRFGGNAIRVNASPATAQRRASGMRPALGRHSRWIERPPETRIAGAGRY